MKLQCNLHCHKFVIEEYVGGGWESFLLRGNNEAYVGGRSPLRAGTKLRDLLFVACITLSQIIAKLLAGLLVKTGANGNMLSAALETE